MLFLNVKDKISPAYFLDGVEEREPLSPADSLEVVRVDGPHHGAAQVEVLDVVGLGRHRLDVVVAQPLGALVHVRGNGLGILQKDAFYSKAALKVGTYY